MTIELDELWGEQEEETVEAAPPTETRKERKKKERPVKVEDTSVGFRTQLGTCRRRGKDGKIQDAPILLAKDHLCWILRVGSSQTYPTSLAVVFETISKESALELNGDADVGALVKETRAIEERVAEMGRVLDQRIREYIDKRAKHK